VTTVATDEKQPQHPTVAELEEAITHLAETCRRYGRFAQKYGEWHEEINHLLTDRETALLTRSGGVL
jgi:hypothetical protein